VLGARTEAQLADTLAAAAWELTPEETARLDEVSETYPPYPVWFQRQFTAERGSRAGADPAHAHRYD
jgi:hypothetical protein